jgi:pyruvate,water dikinase
MQNILWFKEVGIKNVPEVGGKNASLGEMRNNLTSQGVSVPDGFATSAAAYFNFLEIAGLKNKIGALLDNFDYHDLKALAIKGKAVRTMILKAELPDDLQKEITQAYHALSQEYGVAEADVAVRSSATAEDLPNASFAGQQETFLNIKGADDVVEAVKKCFASLFTDRAIAYRQEMGFSHLKVGLSAGVQKMVRSDLAASGVMFSCDTESGFPDVVLINAGFGLGENVVLGRIDPDQYYVFEKTLKTGHKPIIEKKIGSKELKMIYGKNGDKSIKNIKTTAKERTTFVLNDEEILQLARWSMLVEEHYKKAMDMEWAKDGVDGKLYIVQARPETVQSRRNVNVLEEYKLNVKDAKLKVLARGMSVGSKIGSGRAHIIKSAANIGEFKKGEVLVTGMTDPDWVPAMKLASAIVTDAGGRTCHAAIVARELGIPCVVGTENGTKVLKSGQDVTVDCSGGEEGRVYGSKIPFDIKKTDISAVQKSKTKILMNVGDPGQAFALSFIPNDGVGLAREEFIIANTIKIHPNALIDYHHTLPKKIKRQVDELSAGYDDKVQFYVDKLAEGIGRIGAAFHPKQVIVRFSDFKTNEYRQLVGGELYEPAEENPMIGWRGSSRYYHPKFKDAFILECKAMKKVREEMGIDNVQPMIPFCRTVEEGKKVLEIMKQAGLVRGDHGLKVYMMCEIPANVILADEFLELFDGFSIGSNDLTQLTLGLDRDNSEIAPIGNEKNEAVKELIKKAVKVCKEKGKYSGICGQAPSDFPDFAEFLVEQGIESISLNPDSVVKTMLVVAQKEKSLNMQNNGV